MRLEFLPTFLNVHRFPIERRMAPCLTLVRLIAPRLDEAVTVAKTFGLPPIPTRLQRSATMKIANALVKARLPVEQAARRRVLERMLGKRIVRAVEACAASDLAVGEALSASRAHDESVQLGAPASTQLALEQMASAAARRAAQAFIAACTLCEEVEAFVVVQQRVSDASVGHLLALDKAGHPEHVA